MSEFEKKTNTNTASPTTTTTATHTMTATTTPTTNNNNNNNNTSTSTPTSSSTDATGLSSPVPRDTNSILQKDCSSHSSADSLLGSNFDVASGNVSPVHSLLIPKRSGSVSPTSSRKPIKVTKNSSTNSNLIVSPTAVATTTTAMNITVAHTTSGKDGKKQKKKKNRCALDNCNNVANKLVGHCQFCDYSFCSSHRLLENHKCAELQTCKQQLHKRNADKLNREQTIVSKI